MIRQVAPLLLMLASCGDDPSGRHQAGVLGQQSPDVPPEDPEQPSPVPEFPTPRGEEGDCEAPQSRFTHTIEQAGDTQFVVDGGAVEGGYGTVMRVDSRGCVAWRSESLHWPHSASMRVVRGEELLLVTETGDGLVSVMSLPSGERVAEVKGLADGSALRYPNMAQWLSDDSVLVTDRDGHRVVEVQLDGTVLWQFGVTNDDGSDSRHLKGPHAGHRLPDGNTIVADSGNDRVLEVDRSGRVVWSYSEGLDWPRDADVLSGGNVLIASSYTQEVLEVSRAGSVVWRAEGLSLPYDVDRLPTGETLVSVFGGVERIPAE